MKIEHDSRVPLWILSIAVLATFSPGQYSTDFESVSASPAGTPLAGQGASAQTGPQGYYVPSTIGSASLDFNAHSYANNSLGVAQNPTGGCNFIGVTGPGNGIFGRTEVDITYPTPVVTVAFDICVRFTGALPANNNIGSVALQPSPGSRRFIAIAVWSDPATATNWDAYYRRFDYNG
ncbi:MAG TPA: hypothetical protein PKA37_18500, partial [Planctomycetota bacterium]|nr:hypothetical protein [Planctomycetota bacterium]